MTFHRIHRGIPEPEQVTPTPHDGIVLFWRNFRSSPILTISLGRLIAEQLGMRGPRETVHLFVGSGDDAGMAAIQHVPWNPDPNERGDFRTDWRGNVCRVFLSHKISKTHFPDFATKTIPADKIKVDGSTVYFPVPQVRK